MIRSESPVITIGGGRVLDPSAQRNRKPTPQVLEMVSHLRSPDALERASAALYFAGFQDWNPDELPRTAGIEASEQAHTQLLERGDLLEIAASPTRTVRIHKLVFAQLCDRIEAVLGGLHDQYPLRTTLPRSMLMNGFRYLKEDTLLSAALKQMQSAGRIKYGEKGVALVGRGPKLSQNEQKLLAALIEMFHEAGLQPPSIKECQSRAPKNQDSVPQLLALASANGDLVEIGEGLYLHAEAERDARQLLVEQFRNGDGLTMSQIREILNTTRKYAVPFCEYLDRIGFTKRQGDLRVLADAAVT